MEAILALRPIVNSRDECVIRPMDVHGGGWFAGAHRSNSADQSAQFGAQFKTTRPLEEVIDRIAFDWIISKGFWFDYLKELLGGSPGKRGGTVDAAGTGEDDVVVDIVQLLLGESVQRATETTHYGHAPRRRFSAPPFNEFIS